MLTSKDKSRVQLVAIFFCTGVSLFALSVCVALLAWWLAGLYDPTAGYVIGKKYHVSVVCPGTTIVRTLTGKRGEMLIFDEPDGVLESRFEYVDPRPEE